jgi:hypothetical protein
MMFVGSTNRREYVEMNNPVKWCVVEFREYQELEIQKLFQAEISFKPEASSLTFSLAARAGRRRRFTPDLPNSTVFC